VEVKGADAVILPALPSEQVRQFIRASKAENTLRGYSLFAGSSLPLPVRKLLARGASARVCLCRSRAPRVW
jgi:hypothetical protein